MADKLNGKRIKAAFWMFSLIMGLLAARLWYIQIICHEELEVAAASQHRISIEGLDTRGRILDRNLRPLTGGTKQYYYIIDRNRADKNSERIMERLAAKQIAKKTSSYLVYRSEKYSSDTSNELKERYGAYVFQSSSRYADDQTACHLLGYLNAAENRGVSGIELMYQQELEDDGSRLALWADAAGGIIRGIAPSVTESRQSREEDKAMEPHSVVTTIDRRLQHVCEEALQAAGEGGAAVVMDVRTGEIMAWASSPCFNPNDIQVYLDSKSDCLIDKVCQGAYAPGSVFKIVTAAAALEKGVCDENQVFECTGEITIEGVRLKCSTSGEGGHGRLNMGQAMACSCNSYFAQLGLATGCGEIMEMAERLGLGTKVLKDFPQERKGNIPDAEEVGTRDVTNLSIGQGEILVTPLQIARLTAVIAAGGREICPTFILGEENISTRNMVSEDTAVLIQEMMKGVMEEGTGKGQWKLPVWGKTGTAEAVYEGREVKNCWFTGYFTVGGSKSGGAEAKTYAVTVMVERGSSGTYTAMPVFKAVVDFLSKNH